MSMYKSKSKDYPSLETANLILNNWLKESKVNEEQIALQKVISAIKGATSVTKSYQYGCVKKITVRVGEPLSTNCIDISIFTKEGKMILYKNGKPYTHEIGKSISKDIKDIVATIKIPPKKVKLKNGIEFEVESVSQKPRLEEWLFGGYLSHDLALAPGHHYKISKVDTSNADCDVARFYNLAKEFKTLRSGLGFKDSISFSLGKVEIDIFRVDDKVTVTKLFRGEMLDEFSFRANQKDKIKGLDEINTMLSNYLEQVTKLNKKHRSNASSRSQKKSSTESKEERVKLTKNTRRGQVFDGVKRGFKKGIVTGSSKLVADTISESAEFEDKEWLVKFVQLAITASSAEMLDLIPASVSEKVKISEQAKDEAARVLREVAGENMGRNIVEYTASILPHFKEVLSDFTAEEIVQAGDSLSEEDIVEKIEVETDEPVLA